MDKVKPQDHRRRYPDLRVDFSLFSKIKTLLGFAHQIPNPVYSAAQKQEQLIALLLQGQNETWSWETDADGNIVAASTQFFELVDRAEVEIIGRPFTSYIRDPKFIEEFFAERGKSIDAQVQLRGDRRDRNWKINARMIKNETSTFSGYVGIGSAVESPERLISEQAAAITKSNFLASISHELRTPINAIVGFSEILSAPQSESLSHENRRTYLNTIIENAKTLQNMINDILDMTRFEKGSFKLIEQENDAAEILEAVVKASRVFAETARVSIVAHLLDDVTAQGDLLRLKQTLHNLIINAIKFSPPDSIVNVSMARGPADDLYILVRDAGIGVHENDAARAFENFVQLEEGSTRRYSGLGLGLSIAQKIANLHGGEISLDGKLGIGTEAKLTLPAWRVQWGKAKLVNNEKVAA